MDWQRVEDLFGQVVDLPPSEQKARLARVCPDDEIRAQVERLLGSLQKAGTFLETPALQMPEIFQVTQAGPYRLERLLGRGGMGEVYLAVRDDDEYRREVAVKLLPATPGDQERLLRFRTERQLLAQLEHPNIARLYDGGTTEDGRPYLVMEYIQGSPIDAYCDEKGLSVGEKLHLFQEVCAAVSYAHRRLMIHRDIKPGNILVTAEGVPKLLDFGVAKSLEPGADSMTRTGPAPMTPAYASPEQIKGGEVTTASDIYALGIVLYELLTGTRPHQQALFTGEATRPSLAAAERGERLVRRLQGDLDAILLKALRAEPERRYASVDALSTDIERHLSHQPVEARAGALAYRLEKFYQRNRPLVLVAGVLLVALVVFVVALIRQTHIATKQTQTAEAERHHAERERDRAERAFALLTSAFKVSDPELTRGDEVTARQILDAGADKVRLELKEDPQMQARLLGVLGDVYVSLGLFETAEPLHREALELRRGTEDEALSVYQLAELEWSRRDYHAAELLYRQALAMFDENSIEYAQAQRGLGLVMVWQGQHEAAETTLNQALVALGEHFDEDNEEILRVKFGLGRLARERGDYEKAQSFLTEVLKAQRPGGARPSLGRTLAELGDVRRLQGKLQEARTLLEEAIPMLRMGGETSYVAEALGKLAPVLMRLGDEVAAERAIREILEISPADHPGILFALHNLGSILANRGQFEEAEQVALEALRKKKAMLGDTHESVALASCLLGWIALGQDKPEEARERYESCAAITEKAHPGGNPQMATAWLGIGRSTEALQGCPEAVAWYRRAYTRRREKLGTSHYLTAQSAGFLGVCLGELGRDNEAEELLVESLNVLQTQGFKEDDPRICEAAGRLTDFYRVRGEEGKLAAIPSCH